jgi:tetratricopeptide (TPR) repeat protein
MWELTIVSVIAFVCLGLAVGPATAPGEAPHVARAEDDGPQSMRAARFGLGAAVIVAGWLLICAIAVPFLSGVKLRDSRTAAANGDVRSALTNAAAARDIQPWSSSPYLQLGLVEEQAGNLGAAHAWLRKAIRRDKDDWLLWIVAARIDAERGAVRQARAALARAKELNPRAALFSQ